MEGVLGLRGAVWSEGPLVWVWWGRPGSGPGRAQAQEVDLGLGLGGKEGEGAESNHLYAVEDLFLFLVLASQLPNLFLTVPTK